MIEEYRKLEYAGDQHSAFHLHISFPALRIAPDVVLLPDKAKAKKADRELVTHLSIDT